MPFVDAETLAHALPMTAAIDALEAAFGSERLPEAPLRTHVETRAGTVLLMPAFGEQGVGVKLVTLTPSNSERGLPFIHAVYALFETATQAPVGLLDGAALTAIRTAAVSGLATRHLARTDSSRLAIFGAGVQARSHLRAMLAVRPIEDVVVVSRTRERAETLAKEAGVDARVGAPDEVGDRDLVCTCTTSATPVFDGSLLAPGTHVNAVGAYRPDLRELDTETIERARVVVETRDDTMEEAGDLLIAMKEGAIGEDHVVADLAEVIRGVTVRRTAQDVTVFKSVGVAFEDLVVARAAVDRLGS